jgi:NTE family protein
MNRTLARISAATVAFAISAAVATPSPMPAEAPSAPAPASAATASAQPPSLAHRPRIGLVLAGGGAKGGAHVGVLKVLEQLHVPVDCIAGTSMGALVGGGYASGIPAAGMEKFLLGIDWPRVVGGVGQWEREPIEQKRAGVTYSNSLDMGLRDGHVIVPSGLVSTSGIDDLLRSYVARSRSVTDFDKLPIPYRAVATDMLSGQMVVLHDGDLATAMRASMAIPAIFAPVHLGKYILNDGGMVRNLPVDVARDTCADVVIAVNLVTQPTTPDRLESATQLASRAMEVMINANVEQQLGTLRPGDVRIDVPVGDIGAGDFERVPETIPLGEHAALAVRDQLAHYAVSDSEYLAWRERVTRNQAIDARVSEVEFEGLGWVNPEYLRSLTDVRPGDVVDNQRISEQARTMSAVQDVSSVGYRLSGDPKAPTLTWLPQEKSWGPNFLQFDLGLYASNAGDTGFLFYLKQERTWLNALGLQWRNEIQVGGNNLVSTALYQPLDVAERFFVEPRAFWTRDSEFVYVKGKSIADYDFSNIGGTLDFGVNFGARAQLRAGYTYTSRDVAVQTGAKDLPTGTAADAGITAEFIWDSRDTAFNPTRGVAAAVEFMDSSDSLGAERSWRRLEGGLGVAVPWHDDVVWVTAAGGTDLGSNLPVDRYFTLGGPGSFPGLQLYELRSPDYWTLSSSYLWKLGDISVLRGQALYLGARLEAGQVNNWTASDTGAGTVGYETLYGGSLYLTGRTPIGPLTLGAGATTYDSWSVWLSIGRPVGQGTILERGIFR